MVTGIRRSGGDAGRAMGERAIGWSTSLWLLICASLAGVVILELSSSLPLAPEVTAAAPAALPAAAPATPRFEPPPAGAFQDIALRPLFFESRRPFVPQPLGAEGVDAPVDKEALAVELVGTLVTDQHRAALLQPADQAASWRREGDRIAGWRIGTIERDRVTLRLGEEIETLELRADLAGPARAQKAGGKRKRDRQQQAVKNDPARD
jgi:hypothetical protein